MSQPTTVTRWTTGEIVGAVGAIFGFPAAIAALIAILAAIQGALRKRKQTEHIATQDIELGTLSAVQIESGPNAMSAPQQRVIQSLRRGDLARDILQPSSVRVQPSEEQDRSVFRLRHHSASVPEGVSSSVTTVHERRARFQESRVSIGTSLEDFATWKSLEIRTEEAKDQIAREKTEWQEVCLSRNAPVAASSSWPDLE